MTEAAAIGISFLDLPAARTVVEGMGDMIQKQHDTLTASRDALVMARDALVTAEAIRVNDGWPCQWCRMVVSFGHLPDCPYPATLAHIDHVLQQHQDLELEDAGAN